MYPLRLWVSSEAHLSLLRPFISSTALCLLCGPLPPLWISVSSLALCPLYILRSLYCPMILLQLLSFLRHSATSTSSRPSAHFTSLSPVYIWPSDSSTAHGPSTALCPFYCSLSSVALCLLYRPLPSLQPSVLSTTLCTPTALCPLLRYSVPSMALKTLYSSMSLLVPLPVLWPFISSTAICHPLRPSTPSTALCFLNNPLCPLRPSVPSTALCLLFTNIFSLKPFVPSTALCPYDPTSPLTPFPPLRPSMTLCLLYNTVLSTALCLLNSPFSLYGPSVPSKAVCLFFGLCLLNSPLSSLWPSVWQNSETSEMTPLVSRNVLRNAIHQHTYQLIADCNYC